MGKFIHDALFLSLLPSLVKVGCVHLPVGGQGVPVKDVHKVSDDMGLTVVDEVLVNGYQVNGSLGSVEGFNGPVNKDMVSCKQPLWNLQEQDRSVDKLVHEA